MWRLLMKKMFPNLGKLIGASLAFLTILALSSSCSRNDNKPTMLFLSTFGLKGIDSERIIRSSSNPGISNDYKNKIYFALLRFTKTEFDQFCTTNDFKREDVLALPSRESHWPKVPIWL